VLSLYLLNGITTARGMLGDPKHLTLRTQLDRGERFGPRLITSGPSLNGTSTPTIDAGIRAVREQKAAGYDFMKIHPGIPRVVFDSIAATADRLKIGFAGHVPVDVGLGRALSARYQSVDHVDGVIEALLKPTARDKAAGSQFFGLNLIDDIDPTRLDSVVRAIKSSGVSIVTTQTIFDNIAGFEAPEVIAAKPEMRYWPNDQVQSWIRSKQAFLAGAAASPDQRTRYLAFRQTILKALRAANVPIVLGSDGPQVWNVPGFSVHREMQALVDAGWSPYDVLRMGTVNVAMFFNWTDAGTVTPGARADLILLDANPLDDIANASKLQSVIRAGRLHDRAELDARLEALAVSPRPGQDAALFALQNEIARYRTISGGTLGVTATHIESGRTVRVNGDTRFPMASTVKVPIALRLLAMADSGRLRLDSMITLAPSDLHPGSGTLTDLFAQPGVALSVRNLMELMLLISDNSATDVLLRTAGGGDAVKSRLAQLGIAGISVDRPTVTLIADAIGVTGLPPLDQLTIARFNAAAQSVSDSTEKAAAAAFYNDPRDMATPDGMTTLLTMLWQGRALSRANSELLLDIMRRCRTGDARIKGLLPPGTEVRHKTGTLGIGVADDVGIITLPNGAGHVAISVFVKESAKPPAEQERGIAHAARAVYDFFTLSASPAR
jgi:beta-lactamase class A